MAAAFPAPNNRLPRKGSATVSWTNPTPFATARSYYRATPRLQRKIKERVPKPEANRYRQGKNSRNWRCLVVC